MYFLNVKLESTSCYAPTPYYLAAKPGVNGDAALVLAPHLTQHTHPASVTSSHATVSLIPFFLDLESSLSPLSDASVTLFVGLRLEGGCAHDDSCRESKERESKERERDRERERVSE